MNFVGFGFRLIMNFKKTKPPHKKEKEKCTNKICRPVEEQN
jgi:hypothetical protein